MFALNPGSGIKGELAPVNQQQCQLETSPCVSMSVCSGTHPSSIFSLKRSCFGRKSWQVVSIMIGDGID